MPIVSHSSGAMDSVLIPTTRYCYLCLSTMTRSSVSEALMRDSMHTLSALPNSSNRNTLMPPAVSNLVPLFSPAEIKSSYFLILTKISLSILLKIKSLLV